MNHPAEYTKQTINRFSSSSFAINGRFYSQRVTGVQRYAREIVQQIDKLCGIRGAKASLMLPPGVKHDPVLRSLYQVNIGQVKGHIWEQTILPVKNRIPLLNLCNTAPVAFKRQIVCMHDANVFETPQSYGLPFQVFYHLLQPLLARRSAVVTSVSRTSAERISYHLQIPLKNIEVVPNGHEHVLQWNSNLSNVSGRFRTGRPFILMLGSAAKHKNAEFLLRQALALDNMGLDLVVAGGGARIFSQIEVNLASNIHHLGFVSDDDLAWLYTNALCLAFPSLTEGFGIPLVEAMALGCPIVSSNRSCMPEVYGDAALSADPEDAIEWLINFKKLARSRSLREDLIERGRIQVQKFSWSASAQHYLDLISMV